MGIKDRRTQILLTLQLIDPTGSKFVDMNSNLSSSFGLEFNKKTSSALYQLELDGLVTKLENIPGTFSFSITGLGFDELCLRFPFFRFSKQEWDSNYRILSYEIPEKKRELRDRLRRSVSGWGLGPWHRSFWITPHPIIPALRQLVSQKEEEQYIQAFESIHVFGDNSILIEKVWNIKYIEAQYKKMFKRWHEILSTTDSNEIKLRHIVNSYVDLLNIDPGLPKQLVGDKWIGFEANNIFNEIKDILVDKKTIE